MGRPLTQCGRFQTSAGGVAATSTWWTHPGSEPAPIPLTGSSRQAHWCSLWGWRGSGYLAPPEQLEHPNLHPISSGPVTLAPHLFCTLNRLHVTPVVVGLILAFLNTCPDFALALAPGLCLFCLALDYSLALLCPPFPSPSTHLLFPTSD